MISIAAPSRLTRCTPQARRHGEHRPACLEPRLRPAEGPAYGVGIKFDAALVSSRRGTARRRPHRVARRRGSRVKPRTFVARATVGHGRRDRPDIEGVSHLRARSGWLLNGSPHHRSKHRIPEWFVRQPPSIAEAPLADGAAAVAPSSSLRLAAQYGSAPLQRSRAQRGCGRSNRRRSSAAGFAGEAEAQRVLLPLRERSAARLTAARNR